LSRFVVLLLLTLDAATGAAQSSVEAAMKFAAAGKLEEAESILRDLERTNGRNADVQYRLGLILLKRGKPEDALHSLELASKLNPNFPFVWAALALVHESLAKAMAAHGDAPGAARELQQAIRLDPARPPYYLELVQLLLDHEPAEPAEIILQNAALRFPKNSDVLRMLGLARFALGKTQPALDSFLRAIDADPDAEVGYASLETLLPEAGDRLPEIAARLRRFASQHGESPIGPYLLAMAGEPNHEDLLRRAIRNSPGFWPAHFELYKALRERDNWEQALSELRKTLELNADFAPAHYAMAEYYNRTGDRAGAARERELHHQLLEAQRRAEQEHRASAPRLAFTVESK